MLTDVHLAGEPVGLAFAFANALLFAMYIVLADRRPSPPAGRRASPPAAEELAAA